MYPPTRGNLGLKRPGAIAQKNPFHAVSGHYRHYRLKKVAWTTKYIFFFLNCPYPPPTLALTTKKQFFYVSSY